MAAPTKKTASGWKSAKRHSVTLPSAFEVEIEVPNLPQLVKTGQLPNELVTEALNTAATGNLTPEVIASQADFYNKLVAFTVKEPAITEEDVPDLPFEDIELLVEIATRQRDVDALGHHLAGLDKVADWRKFRGLDYGDEDVAGL